MFIQPAKKTRKMQNKTMKRRVAKTTRKNTTYDVDIAQEFNDVKQTFASRMDKLDNKLDAFKDEISAWRSIFESKLTELNTNMKTMLERLAQHDFRFTEHEKRISTLWMVGSKSTYRHRHLGWRDVWCSWCLENCVWLLKLAITEDDCHELAKEL